jgi:anaerobic ribonucleoside-triphosphate reductase activating protein
MFDRNGSIWMAGIPGRGDLERMRHLLNHDGHQVVTSEDRAIQRIGVQDPQR